MSDACSADGCLNRPRARGLCATHYSRAYRAGQIPITEPSRELSGDALAVRHVITDPDLDRKVATCSVCGPVSIYVHHRKDRPNPRVECAVRLNAVRRNKRGSPRRRGLGPRVGRVQMPRAEYDQLVAAQGGQCAICQAVPDRLFIDHHHGSGVVRKLLCHWCNCAIGFVREDPDIARGVAQYLERHNAGI